MKKVLSLFLVLVLSLSLVGCSFSYDLLGGAKDKGNEDLSGSDNLQLDDSDTDGGEDAKLPDESGENEGKPSDSDTGSDDSASGGAAAGGDVGPDSSLGGSDFIVEDTEELLLYDSEGMKVTFTGLSVNEWDELAIGLRLENNTDRDLTFSCEVIEMSGYSIPVSFYATVTAGKKANEELTVDEMDYALTGLDTLAYINLDLEVLDADNYDKLYTLTGGKLTFDAADGYVPAKNDAGLELYSENGVRIVAMDLYEMYDGEEYWVTFFFENNTDNGLTFTVEDSAVNGYMLDGWMSADVLGGTYAVYALCFRAEDLQSNGITAIEDIELSFHVFDMESFNTLFDTEALRFVIESN